MAKNIIKLNRGDSCEFKVSTNLSDTDVAYFALLYHISEKWEIF